MLLSCSNIDLWILAPVESPVLRDFQPVTGQIKRRIKQQKDNLIFVLTRGCFCLMTL